MEQVDLLTTANVKSGPLKALLHRMLHQGNLDKKLKPAFKNDAAVTAEKITFTQTVFDANEAYFRQQFGDEPSKLMSHLSRIAAAADYLRGDDPEEIAQRYSLVDGETDKATARKLILSLGTRAAKLYSWLERERLHGEAGLVENIHGLTRERGIAPRGSTEQHEVVVKLPGFESLHNVVLDLYEAGKFTKGGAYAGGLLVLFERETVKPGVDVRRLLEDVRRTLRSHMGVSPELNRQGGKGGNTDVELRRGATFLHKLVQQRPRAMSQPPLYNTMAVLDSEALMGQEGLAKEDARAFVESRIAYALHTLYINR